MSNTNTHQKLTLLGVVRYLVLPLCLLAFTLAAGCSQEEAEPPATVAENAAPPTAPVQQKFQTVSAAQAQDMLHSKKALLLIDVRTPQERRQMRISNSLAIPVGDVIRGKLQVPPTQPVLLLCAVGGRSYVAGKALISRGYQEVYNLDGGIESWRRAGLPLETGPE